MRTAPSDVSWSHALPLVGLGSYFLIQALIVLNQGWVAQVSGIASTTAFAVLLLGILAMAAGSWMAFARPSLHRLAGRRPGGRCSYSWRSRAPSNWPAYLPVVVLLIQFTLGWGLGLIVAARCRADPHRPRAHFGHRRGWACSLPAAGLRLLRFLRHRPAAPAWLGGAAGVADLRRVHDRRGGRRRPAARRSGT